MKLPNNYYYIIIFLDHTLRRYTASDMLKSNMHSALYSLELESMRKNDDMVKRLTCLINVYTVSRLLYIYVCVCVLQCFSV